MTLLTITHTHEAGTLIEGTSRGDGTAEVLKANGWRWGRSISSWYVPHSRDRLPKRYVVDATKRALEAAGFSVETDLDESLRSAADVEAGKAARQDDRVAALEAKAARKQQKAVDADARASRDLQQLPPMGEPIKIGHHSEARHRAAFARVDSSMRRSIAASDEAAAAEYKAQAAAHTTTGRYAPTTVANRIKKLEADLRRLERSFVADVRDPDLGYRPATAEEIATRRTTHAARAAELADQIAYWKQVREEQIASGAAPGFGPETIVKGDQVKISGSWWEVARVNPKTVSVIAPGGFSHRADYAAITERKRTAA